MTKNVLAAALALAAGHAALAADPAETVSREEDRESVAVTIYNDDLALIRETRKVPLNAGINRIALRDVSARIMPQTATLVARGDAVLQLLEQNFDYDLLSGEALLAKNVGKRVTTIRTNPATGEETREDATVLADNNGVVLQYADRIETGLPANVRLAFHDVPANLRDRPTLTVDLTSDKAGEQSVDLAYLSQGLGWKADYVASIARVLHQLNGEHHLILGNHDEVIAKNRDYFLHTTKADGRPLLASIKNYRQVVCDGCSQPLVLFHYPIQEWDGCGKGRYHLYGHVHDRLAPLPGRLLNVGYDLHGRLLKAHDIETYLRDLPALVHHDGQNTFRPADTNDARTQIAAALRRLNG